MLRQAQPSSAAEYGREQRREIVQAVAAVRRQWRRMGTDFDVSWPRVAPRLLEVTDLAQSRVAAGALAFIPDVLEDTGQSRAATAVARPNVRALVGVAGDGRPVDSLLYGAVTRAKERVASGATPTQALRASSQWLTMATGTLLSDTGRQAESLGMGVRPVGGYVRMLNTPSCSRCVALAGRWYRKSSGFLRHPGCDCRHIPASESVAGDLTVSPSDYFDSLSPGEQDVTFGKAGAEAIREGADVSKVVNARRGMRTAQVGGRNVLTTTEGITRRGQASRAATGRRGARLMPETISQVATDREGYLRLLRVNGYI